MMYIFISVKKAAFLSYLVAYLLLMLLKEKIIHVSIICFNTTAFCKNVTKRVLITDVLYEPIN